MIFRTVALVLVGARYIVPVPAPPATHFQPSKLRRIVSDFGIAEAEGKPFPYQATGLPRKGTPGA